MKLDIRGHSAYCYTNGRDMDPARESVVFVHGAGLDHTVWTLFARHFARHGRNVIVPDLPAHGRSDGEALATIEDMADWVAALIDLLGLSRIALVGHSMGSLVALDYAARYPARTRALALAGATAPMAVSDAILDASAANDHAAFDMLTQWGFSKRHLYGGNKNPGMWMVGGSLRLYEQSRPGVLNTDLNACHSYLYGTERAAALLCPVMLVLGREDRLTPVRGTQTLQDALPHADVRLIDGAGHSLMVEATNALQDALHDIL